MRAPGLACCAIVLVAAPAAAQDDCFPARNSNEAEVFAIFSVPLAFGPGGSAEPLRRGRFRVGLEITAIPTIDSATATPTTCRPGKGPENTDLLPAVPRPRVSVGLPGGLLLEASWIPPVTIRGVRANLFGVSLGRPLAVGRRSFLTLRGHATLGTVRAPITCSDVALKDSNSECFKGNRSNDEYHPNVIGVDLSWSVSLGERVHPYVGAGYSRLQPRFQVHFTNRNGEIDNRRVEVDLDRLVVFGGLTWLPTRGTSVSGEAYMAPKDGITGRIVVRRTLGS